MRIHYNISKNEKNVTLCSRIVKVVNTTRIVGCVTCKQCKKLLKSADYSIAQFVRKEEGQND